MISDLEQMKAFLIWARDEGLRAVKVECDGVTVDAVFNQVVGDGPDMSEVPHVPFRDADGKDVPEGEVTEEELYAHVDPA